DQLDPFGRLEVIATRHLDPAPGSQVFLPEYHHRHERADPGNVEPVNLFQQRLVVHQAHEEHHSDSGHNPVDLLDMDSGKLGVHGGAVNLHDAHAANQQHEDQQEPVKIAK